MAIKQIDTAILKTLEEIASGYGYIVDEEAMSAKKVTDSGFDSFDCVVRQIGGAFTAGIGFGKQILPVEQLLIKYTEELSMNISIAYIPTITFNAAYVYPELAGRTDEYGGIPIVATTSGVKEFCEMLKYVVEEKMLPFAEKFNDIKYLEQLVRTELKEYTDFSEERLKNGLLKFIYTQDFRFRIPIIAKLAGVDDYPMIETAVLNDIKELVGDDSEYRFYLDVMHKLLKDLENI